MADQLETSLGLDALGIAIGYLGVRNGIPLE